MIEKIGLFFLISRLVHSLDSWNKKRWFDVRQMSMWGWAVLHDRLPCMIASPAWPPHMHDHLPAWPRPHHDRLPAWLPPLHGRLPCMTASPAWPPPLHDRLPYMTASPAWPPPLHGRIPCMAASPAWPPPLHDHIPCMDTSPAWPPPLHDHIPCMATSPAWLHPLHGRIPCMTISPALPPPLPVVLWSPPPRLRPSWLWTVEPPLPETCRPYTGFSEKILNLNRRIWSFVDSSDCKELIYLYMLRD